MRVSFIQHRDVGDENDAEREDLCPKCGGYLERKGKDRYSCGDCLGGTERDPYARSWETAAWPFDRMN